MMKSGSASCQYYCIDLGRQKLAPAVQALSNFTSKPFALSCMHETSQIDAPVAYSESLAAQGGDNPRCLVRNSHRWLAVAFDWLENDGRESTSDRGLGSQSQQQGIDSVTRPLTSLRKLYVKRQKHWRLDKIRAFCKVT